MLRASGMASALDTVLASMMAWVLVGTSFDGDSSTLPQRESSKPQSLGCPSSEDLLQMLSEERADGLTNEEGYVMDALTEAFLDYMALPVHHEDEPGEFKYHIHMLQGLMAIRIPRRTHPEGWNFDG